MSGHARPAAPPTRRRLRERFAALSRGSASAAGSPWAFFLALLTVLTWGVTGPLFGFSDTWQLVINTGTTIVTFLMVFLIQHDQNRDTKVLQLKLDEIIAATRGASNRLIDLEDLTEEEIERLERRFRALAERTRREGKKGPTSVEEVPSLEASEEKGRREARGRGAARGDG